MGITESGMRGTLVYIARSSFLTLGALSVPTSDVLCDVRPGEHSVTFPMSFTWKNDLLLVRHELKQTIDVSLQ